MQTDLSNHTNVPGTPSQLQLPTRIDLDGKRLPFLPRFVRRVTREYNKAKKISRKAFGRAVFSIPLFSRHDPRRQLVSFRDHCRHVEHFSEALESIQADWQLPILPPETAHRVPSITLNDDHAKIFRKWTARFNGGEAAEMPAVFLACVHDAKIYSDDFLVLSRENKIFFESALSRPDVLESNGILDTLIRPKLKIVRGDFCLLGCPWAPKNYSEWLFGVIPRLCTIDDHSALSSLPLILPKRMPQYQLDSLEIAGVDRNRIMRFDGGYWQVSRLFFPALRAPLGNPSPRVVAWLRERFLKKIVHKQTGSRLLYISRRDASQRRIINEEEIVNYLQGIGFDVICPGDLSLAEQISTFSNARLVIGPHGAGMANMVFAPSDATLIELFGDNYLHGAFWAVANTLGQKHATLIGRSVWLDYYISLDQLKQLIQKVANG